MHQDDRDPRLSKNASYVFSLLARRGGTMRTGPLVDATGLPADEVADAINELALRRWVEVTWRRPRARLPWGASERFREVERITTTRFGRWRHPVTWHCD